MPCQDLHSFGAVSDMSVSLAVPGVSCCQAGRCSFQRICLSKRTMSREFVDEPWVVSGDWNAIGMHLVVFLREANPRPLLWNTHTPLLAQAYEQAGSQSGMFHPVWLR